MKDKKKKKKKIEYHRLTFILSLIGFMGSIGFYLGVLKQVYSPQSKTYKIEQLEKRNAQLEDSVYKLATELAKENE